MMSRTIRLWFPALLLVAYLPQSASARTVAVSVGTARASAGDSATVPVVVRDCEGLSGLECELRYDTRLLEFIELTAAPLLQDSVLVHEEIEPGVLKVGLVADQTITGNAELFSLKFRATGEAGSTAGIELARLLATDEQTREMLVNLEDGRVLIGAVGWGPLDVLISLLAIAGIVVLVYRLRSGSSKPDRAVDSSVAVGQGKQADTERPQAPSFTANGTSPGGPANGSSATDRSASRH